MSALTPYYPVNHQTSDEGYFNGTDIVRPSRTAVKNYKSSTSKTSDKKANTLFREATSTNEISSNTLKRVRYIDDFYEERNEVCSNIFAVDMNRFHKDRNNICAAMDMQFESALNNLGVNISPQLDKRFESALKNFGVKISPQLDKRFESDLKNFGVKRRKLNCDKASETLFPEALKEQHKDNIARFKIKIASFIPISEQESLRRFFASLGVEDQNKIFSWCERFRFSDPSFLEKIFLFLVIYPDQMEMCKSTLDSEDNFYNSGVDMDAANSNLLDMYMSSFHAKQIAIRRNKYKYI